MVCSAVFVTDLNGKVLIARNYRGDVAPSVVEKFAQRLATTEHESGAPPIFVANGVTFAYLTHQNVCVLAVTKRNANAALMLSFLNSLVQVFTDYFGELQEESIRDNFVIIYELLDECMDFGYPQFTESKILKDVICVKEKHTLKLGGSKKPSAEALQQMTRNVSWRPPGIKHKKNEVFLDVVEKLNLLVGSNGRVLHSEIVGALKMKSYLSGMPELKLGLNDKLLLEGRRAGSGRATRGKLVEMDDIRFHQCVRLSRFESDRSITFVPPDGEFDLMTYRLDTRVRPLIWVETHIERHSHSRVEYMVKARAEFKRRSTANNVQIVVPVPDDADSPHFRTTCGEVDYVPEDNAIVWHIPQFRGQDEFLMRAHFGLPSITAADAGDDDQDELAFRQRPIRIHFEIPYFTVSGIQVRYLKIIEKSGYQALPWVRYITQNGDYQIRIGS
ncbi:MAG: AP-1 complex subunit mu-1 [Cercozoa sp. M6MM]